MVEEVLYRYLDGFNLEEVPAHFLADIATRNEVLPRCHIHVLCEMLAKSLILNRPFDDWQVFLDCMYSNAIINKNEGWGLVLGILASEVPATQKVKWLYFNQDNPERLMHVLSQIVECFEEGLQRSVSTSIMTILKTYTIAESEVKDLELLTFRVGVSNLEGVYKENHFLEKERVVFNSLKEFYRDNHRDVCDRFLEFLLDNLSSSFMNPFRQWMKVELSSHGHDHWILGVLELFCRGVAKLEENTKEALFASREIFEIPQLYSLYQQLVDRQLTRSYPFFEQFMFKYSLIRYLIPVVVTHVTNCEFSSLEDLLTNRHPHIFSKFFEHPHTNWKILVSHYLTKSAIKLKNETHDPLVFMLVKKAFWEDIFHAKVLSLCIWVSLLEWRQLVTERTSQVEEYFAEMYKLVVYFLLTLPKTEALVNLPNQIPNQYISTIALGKSFGAICGRCPYVTELPWISKVVEHSSQICVSSEESPILVLKLVEKFKARMIPDIGSRILIAVEVALRRGKSPFNRPNCNMEPLRSLVVHLSQFKDLESHCKFVLSML